MDIIRQKKRRLCDGHGRLIDYMRLSVTDRCNLTCKYCHPPRQIEYLERSKICSFKELLQVAEVASKLGVQKIRLTGGELFLRKEIVQFVDSLCRINRLGEVVLTTNGTLLVPHLKRLKRIGIKRINVSLDTLSKDLYYNLTGKDKFRTVLEGIHRAKEEDFKVKINMVVLKGINETEIIRFIQYFSKLSVEVRFIEFMPLCGDKWREDYFFSFDKIIEMITSRYNLIPRPSSGVAQEFSFSGENGIWGVIGIIAPMTRSFCAACSRLRLSANGDLWPCLFSTEKVSLLPILRGSFTAEERENKLIEAFHNAVQLKPPNWPVGHSARNVFIRSIGG